MGEAIDDIGDTPGRAYGENGKWAGGGGFVARLIGAFVGPTCRPCYKTVFYSSPTAGTK